jgi:vacuolar-type H+-ATPase subunit H
LPSSPASGVQEPLERLRGDEAELERSLTETRSAAAAAVAAARGDAERIVAEARGALERELAALRADEQFAAAAEEARARDRTREELEALRHRVARNRSRALVRLLGIVLGREGS